jgi:hypothetical protein
MLDPITIIFHSFNKSQLHFTISFYAKSIFEGIFTRLRTQYHKKSLFSVRVPCIEVQKRSFSGKHLPDSVSKLLSAFIRQIISKEKMLCPMEWTLSLSR